MFKNIFFLLLINPVISFKSIVHKTNNFHRLFNSPVKKESIGDLIKNIDSSKINDISNIYTLFINTTTDIIYKFCNELNQIETDYDIHVYGNNNVVIRILNSVKEMIHIIEYCNECIDNISKTYKSSMLSKKITPILAINQQELSIHNIFENFNNHIDLTNE